MSRNVFLFGAGASYGSDTEGTPPLGSGLFDALQAFSPDTWGNISPVEGAVFRTDFEKGMRAFTKAHATDGTVDCMQRAMAAYFFQFKPQPGSLYVNLAKRIQDTRWDGALATLNYERLLELSLRGVGLNVIVGGPSHDSIELCLPHGCCHLFIRVKVQGSIVLASPKIKMDSCGPPVAIDNESEFRKRICTDKLPPVMCYFEPGKDARAGMSFLEGQRKMWKKLAQTATTIAVVGVRPRRNDAHVWEPLASTPARIIYCGGPCAAPEYKDWAKRYRSGRKDTVLQGYFLAEFDTICKAVGL